MSRNLRIAHLPLLTNPYGSVRHDLHNPKVAGRVSAEDKAFLKQLFPFIPNLDDIIISRLYHNFCLELRAAVPVGTDPAYTGAGDPLYVTLSDILARCTPRGSLPGIQQPNPTPRTPAGEPDELREALRVLEDVGPNPESRDAGSSDETEEDEEQCGSGGGTVEGVVGVDPELSNLFNLLKS